jgi:hypothetical protein
LLAARGFGRGPSSERLWLSRSTGFSAALGWIARPLQSGSLKRLINKKTGNLTAPIRTEQSLLQEKMPVLSRREMLDPRQDRIVPSLGFDGAVSGTP